MNMPACNQTLTAIFYNNPDEYPPIINGVRLLAQAGWHVNLLCRDNGKQWKVEYPKEVRVERIRANEKSSWLEYLGFLRQVLLRNHKRSRLFVGHDMHGLLPARLLASRFRRPLVYHCHDFADRNHSAPLGSRVVRAFEQRFARTANLLIVPDKERASVMEAALRMKHPALIVANAPLLRPANQNELLRQTLAAKGLKSERILLRQGRIGVGHAIDATVRSIPFWAKPEWSFVVMGFGEGDYLDHLTSVAKRQGVGEQFVILPAVGYDHVAAYTAGADAGHALYEPIHVNNVHITTASNKIMEYMAAGLPLLVSDTPALGELVEKFSCGVTANERSSESIAAAVNTLLGCPVRAAQMGKAGRRVFEEVFCYDRQFAPVLEWLAIQSSSRHRSLGRLMPNY
jgi:glycosyltransferase involved in cell wall biosynthesis